MKSLGALLLIAGCSADPCASFDGHTCVALELHGNFAIDRLGIAISGIFAEQLSPPDGPRRVQLPVAIAVLPGDALSEPITIDVRALRDGQLQALAHSPALLLGPGEHRSLVLDLLRDFNAFDLSSVRDLAPPFVTDLFELPDLADAFSASDLNGFDLAPFFGQDMMLQPCNQVTVSTLAGDGTFDFLDAQGASARFSSPLDVAVDGSGNVYVADSNNHRIRKIAPDGTTTTLAGNGTQGFFDGTGGPLGTTELSTPSGVAVDSTGIVYVGDAGNHRIRKIASNGATTTLAGNGTGSFFNGTGGPTGTTEFFSPWGVTVDLSGNVYVADHNNHRIRKVGSDGSTVTLAGSGTNAFADGPPDSAQFNFPIGVVLGDSGRVFVADFINNRIREVLSTGTTSTLTGNGAMGTTDGTGGPLGTTQLSGPAGVAYDLANHILYVGEQNNNRIRKVLSDGTTSTVTGSVGGGFQEGNGCTARFNNVQGLAFFNNQLFVADAGNSRIRIVQLP